MRPRSWWQWRVIGLPEGSRRRPAMVATMVALALASCRSGSGGSRPPADLQIGTFDYVAHLSRYEMRGVMVVLPDTILVQPEGESCQPVMGPADAQNIRYECVGTADFDNVILRIDRRNPVQWSKWSATVSVRRSRQVCDEYRTNAQGQRVCVRYRTEFYTEKVRQSGPLTVRIRTSAG